MPIWQADGGFLARYGVLLGFLVLWQGGSTFGQINASVSPSRDSIVAAFWKGLTQGSLWADVAISLQLFRQTSALAV